ncbi:MAG TPA: arsenate reductase ArsC [Hydrogenophaga sp.]|uniref:arsenate reductase ArsC n=1 Tax=Hydrogenophaga sp. TaxID=1904254 RepID=UPI002CCF3C13|nr:arsenate reductase ArsC [Hydrogenophaga sp.]HSX93281.1 arsenate reductase ArsC [Hydrogenophaga sp.]
METRPYNVLFVCTGNSARSLMAEAVLNQLGGRRFRAFSAGSQPAGQPHPLALELLQRHRYDTSTLRSKSWDEFALPGAPVMDFVLTVCDSAAGETCPVWPGQPMSAHWGVEDPAAVTGSEARRRQAFNDAFLVLTRRITILLSLPLGKLDTLSLQKELRHIGLTGNSAPATEGAA